LGEYSEGKATQNRALAVYKSGALRSVNTGVEVEMRKSKRYESRMGSRGEGRAKEKENRFFFVFENIRGPTRFEVRTAIVPQQRCQKACWVF